jgi:hypothetical protein
MENLDLRILPLAELLPHERTDPRRVDPLAARLRDEALLRNPPIVAPLAYGDPRFVVLDGANRVTALRAMGFPHIIAQVVDYSSVALHTWHHAITLYRADDLIAQIAVIPGLTCEQTDLIHARALLARREALAFVSVDRIPPLGGAPVPVAYVVEGGHTLRERTDLLNQLVDRYEGVSRIQRTTSDTLAEVRASFPDTCAVVVFPHYEPAEIIDLVREHVELPAGITRHVLPLRALRVNYPLDVLRSQDTIEAKHAHLREWVAQKMATRQVRTYSEPTVLFDE